MLSKATVCDFRFNKLLNSESKNYAKITKFSDVVNLYILGERRLAARISDQTLEWLKSSKSISSDDCVYSRASVLVKHGSLRDRNVVAGHLTFNLPS